MITWSETRPNRRWIGRRHGVEVAYLQRYTEDPEHSDRERWQVWLPRQGRVLTVAPSAQEAMRAVEAELG